MGGCALSSPSPRRPSRSASWRGGEKGATDVHGQKTPPKNPKKQNKTNLKRKKKSNFPAWRSQKPGKPDGGGRGGRRGEEIIHDPLLNIHISAQPPAPDASSKPPEYSEVLARPERWLRGSGGAREGSESYPPPRPRQPPASRPSAASAWPALLAVVTVIATATVLSNPAGAEGSAGAQRGLSSPSAAAEVAGAGRLFGKRVALSLRGAEPAHPCALLPSPPTGQQPGLRPAPRPVPTLRRGNASLTTPLRRAGLPRNLRGRGHRFKRHGGGIGAARVAESGGSGGRGEPARRGGQGPVGPLTAAERPQNRQQAANSP